ncbi:TnsD family Tn7-like transposition protein [Terribacillus saccharophilus]|uniref:TnsD family Tn7-like transposition protein n=1 Tax=Terribacillus saccharophilus TaxID=361277 RepID=UPI0015CF2801|nr:TnsD family Tn7-like transposition protein [Terribacillus saccharophilus]
MYENELLYSVIARYQKMCGMISRTALIEDLFGRYISVSSSFFPQYIDLFIKNLPPNSNLTAREVIERHTMFSFYTAFLSKEKTDYIFKTMEQGSNGSKINIEKLIGLGGSKVRKPDYLKYCPLCYKNDLEELGESYWRINHQFIGALYCSEHHVKLKESNILSTGKALEYICADEEVCDTHVLKDGYSEDIKQLNLRYIQDAESLLIGDFPRKELDFIIDFYIDSLRNKRLASTNGSLYIKELQKRFLQYYPTLYLRLMQSEFNPDNLSNWLRLFVRSNNKNRSPVRHLLLMQFLGIDPRALFSTESTSGKKRNQISHQPSLDIRQRREEWLHLIADNPGANRTELKKKGKGLHTWICKYDWEWYDKVTPRIQPKKKRKSTVDWEERDKECLRLAKEAVESILHAKGKPTRVTSANIRRTLGVGPWYRNEKLIYTQKYIREVEESIEDFRMRKIRWAIEDRVKQGKDLSVYKVQLHAGLGGGNIRLKELIEMIMKEIL